jgi:hypothetical protein
MDFLHDYYTKSINIWVGGVLTPATIRWYRAPAGAKYFPLPHSYFSRVWDNNYEGYVAEPGETTRHGRTWDPGRNPGYQGQCYRGDPAWFATGQLPPLNSIQPSACLCQIPPAMGAGGLVLGGSASATNCQLSGRLNTVYIDYLDGSGPVVCFLTTTGAGQPVWVRRTPSFVPQPAVLIRTFAPQVVCITGGKCFLSGQPPFPITFQATGVLLTLYDFNFGKWDFYGDGTFIGTAYTRAP